jgi:glycine cleavage system H protein
MAHGATDTTHHRSFDAKGRRPTHGVRDRVSYPDDVRYSKDHEWVRADGTKATIGITSFAADELGDIVFVELPQVGAALKQFAAFGVVESVKAVSDLFAPLSGTVTEVNARLQGEPELLNSDPFGEGWIAKIDVADGAELEQLLDADGYAKLTN